MRSNSTLNKAIRRIIRDCNDEQLLKKEEWMETLEEYLYYEEADITFMSL